MAKRDALTAEEQRLLEQSFASFQRNELQAGRTVNAAAASRVTNALIDSLIRIRNRSRPTSGRKSNS